MQMGMRQAMAEMTAAEVKTLIESFAAVCGSNSKAKELCGDAVGFIEQQAQEIAKKDQLVKKAIDKLFILPGRDECPDDVLCSVTLPNTPDIGDCRKCWRKWLEKEAEVQG